MVNIFFIFFLTFSLKNSKSDQKDIISVITYDLEDIKMLNLLRPSITYSYDENGVPIKTRHEAINYLITKMDKIIS